MSRGWTVQRPQSSSASRFPAGAFGFLTLTQCLDRAARAKTASSAFPKQPRQRAEGVGLRGSQRPGRATRGSAFSLRLALTYRQCPLYLQKRTLELSREMSASCRKQTAGYFGSTLICCSTTTGWVNANVEPWPGCDPTQIRPPCISMMRFDMASPKPGLDWMTVVEVVPITAALAAIGLLGYIPWQDTVISLALCGATIGFAFFNRLVAKLFLGDVGSLPIGLLLGWLLLLLAGSSGRIAAILLPLYYLADSTVTLQTRSPAKPVTLTATRGKIHNFLFSPLPPEPDLRRHDPDGSPNMADLHFKVNHSRRLFLRQITSLAVDFLKPENLFTVLLVTVFSIL